MNAASAAGGPASGQAAVSGAAAGGDVVVVGSSVAGVRAARALRAEGHAGRVVLVGAEDALPYDKPPLSKQFLSGQWDTARIGLIGAAEAAAAGIELRLGAAADRLDPAARRVHLADGTTLDYGTCVIATGAAARRPPWRTDGGVHVVRGIGDGEALRRDIGRPGHVVVVGGGFVGAEVASTARRLGRDVTVVDPQPVPMARALGDEVGALCSALHGRHGVTTRFGTSVRSVTGGAGDLRVELSDGEVLRAGVVVAGIGAVPNDGWLASSGLRLDDGVVCDAFCRALGADDVFAAGDVARFFHRGHGEHLRVEHWTNAVDQAAHVARNIVHPAAMLPYTPVEYVWSDQYDWRIQVVGRPARAARATLLGRWSGDGARGAALYADERGGLCAAVTVNWPRAMLECRRMAGRDTGRDEAESRIRRLAAAPAPRAIATP